MSIVFKDSHKVSLRKIKDTGELEAPVILCRTGVMEYDKEQLGDNFKDFTRKVKVFTPLEALETQTVLDSVVGLPVTLGHPKDFLDVNNRRELQVGIVKSSPQIIKDSEETKLLSDVLLYTKDSIKIVNSGIDEVSLGYTATLTRVENQPYDAIKSDLHLNHLAIVRKGRAGISKILDNKEEEESILDEKDKDILNYLKEEVTTLKDSLSKVEAERDRIVAERDKLIEEAEAIKSKINDALNEKMGLVSTIAKLGDEYKDIDYNKESVQIKRDVLYKICKNHFTDKSDSYVEARFDLEIDYLEKNKSQHTQNILKDSLNNSNDEPEIDIVEEAKKRRLERYSKM